MEVTHKRAGLMLPIILISIGVFLAFLGKSISQQINSLKVMDMLSDVLNGFISILASILAEIFNKPYEVYKTEFNIFWDILLPGLIGTIAALCLIYAGLLLWNDFNLEDKIESIVRVALIATLAGLSIVIFYASIKLILISLLLIGAIAIFIYFLFGFFNIFSSKDKK